MLAEHWAGGGNPSAPLSSTRTKQGQQVAILMVSVMGRSLRWKLQLVAGTSPHAWLQSTIYSSFPGSWHRDHPLVLAIACLT